MLPVGVAALVVEPDLEQAGLGLEPLEPDVAPTVAENLRVDKLTILDGGDGSGVPSYVNNLTGSAIAMLEQLKNATGIDIEKLAQGATKDNAADVPKELG